MNNDNPVSPCRNCTLYCTPINYELPSLQDPLFTTADEGAGRIETAQSFYVGLMINEGDLISLKIGLFYSFVGFIFFFKPKHDRKIQQSQKRLIIRRFLR